MATDTRTYGPSGKQLDIHRPTGGPPTAHTVLLWHGTGPDERDVLRPLARTAAAHGLTVLVPDWRSDAADDGRGHLLESLAFARTFAQEETGGALTLAGWSAGAGAALATALHPALTAGHPPTAVLALSGRYDLPARTTGTSPLADLAEGRFPTAPVHLLHGGKDTVIPAAHSQTMAEALRQAGHPVTYTELPTDHAGTIMTEYDPATNRCRPTNVEAALAAGKAAVQLLLDAAGNAREGSTAP
ncbi:alpha/beta hydrolase [Streptomyces sp. NPDC018019]|uniref:alpha/beta hydrolase n=1 Tax=Streptomyces sp. NPDC018019 TaxID=3365030 RepID=UPI0037BDFC00